MAQPGPAAQAFAKKAGVAVAALEKITTPKGEYAAATVHRPGQRRRAGSQRSTCPRKLARSPGPRPCIGGPISRNALSARFAGCFVCSDEAVVPAGVRRHPRRQCQLWPSRPLWGPAGPHRTPCRLSRSPRRQPSSMADVAARRHRIRKALDAATRTVPGRSLA